MASQRTHEQLVRTILHTQFHRDVNSITPLGGGINSFVYIVSLTATDNPPTLQSQPGVSPLPSSSTAVVFRLSNPESMLNEAVRVQSEVATMALMRDALSSFETRVIPDVYGWNGSSEGTDGWVLMELMPGEFLGREKFSALDFEEKRIVVRDMAGIFGAIQRYELPASVKGFGGLGFDGEGNVVTGPTPIHGGGPCEELRDLYAEYFETQMGFADRCDVVKGWKGTGVRERLDQFAGEGLKEVLDELSLQTRQTLVHGDFDLQNLLYDPLTKRITALLDFDFSHVGSQADEYFYSFALESYIVPPPICPEPEKTVRTRLLDGFKGALPDMEGVDWKLIQLVDDEFGKAGVRRPHEITGIDELATLYWFIQDISPPMFFLKRWRSRAKPENIERIRQSTQSQLETYLGGWGY
ncbi:hypothetical protein OQA88_3492 [Cercophora sp. LCS_1]